MEFHSNNISDYDEIQDLVDTELFTKLDGCEIIDDNHSFIHFFKGMLIFIDKTIYQNILHGYYHKESGIAKFIVKKPSEIGNLIVNAWRLYIGYENVDVYIYSRYCGKIYVSNEYEIDEKSFKKYFLKQFIENEFDKIC